MPGRIHLYLPGAVDWGAEALVSAGLALARGTNAKVSASVLQFRAPPYWRAGENAAPRSNALEARFAEDAALVAAHARHMIEDAGMCGVVQLNSADILGPDWQAINTARTHDLTLVGLGGKDLGARRRAEDFLFGSGRPVLIWPLNGHAAIACDAAAVAWDHTQAASRAVQGALPLLKRMRRIHLLTVRCDKNLADERGARQAAAYLESHGLRVQADTLDHGDGDIGQLLMQNAIARGAGVLVTGAYSTPKARQFIPGGATDAILSRPLLPVMMTK